jgi:hypothetical protein
MVGTVRSTKIGADHMLQGPHELHQFLLPPPPAAVDAPEVQPEFVMAAHLAAVTFLQRQAPVSVWTHPVKVDKHRSCVATALYLPAGRDAVVIAGMNRRHQPAMAPQRFFQGSQMRYRH